MHGPCLHSSERGEDEQAAAADDVSPDRGGQETAGPAERRDLISQDANDLCCYGSSLWGPTCSLLVIVGSNRAADYSTIWILDERRMTGAGRPRMRPLRRRPGQMAAASVLGWSPRSAAIASNDGLGTGGEIRPRNRYSALTGRQAARDRARPDGSES